MLCGTMWGLNRWVSVSHIIDPSVIIFPHRFQRPAWTTATLITFSFLCGIFAAVFIWLGGKKTKRVREVEKRLRAALDGTDHREPRDILDGSSGPIAEKKLEGSEPVVEEIMLVPSIKHNHDIPTPLRK
jgi:hypothetical protein